MDNRTKKTALRFIDNHPRVTVKGATCYCEESGEMGPRESTIRELLDDGHLIDAGGYLVLTTSGDRIIDTRPKVMYSVSVPYDRLDDVKQAVERTLNDYPNQSHD